MIIEIKGASDGDAVFYLDIEKWERIKMGAYHC